MPKATCAKAIEPCAKAIETWAKTHESGKKRSRQFKSGAFAGTIELQSSVGEAVSHVYIEPDYIICEETAF